MLSTFIDIPNLAFSKYALCPKSATRGRYGAAFATFTFVYGLQRRVLTNVLAGLS
jgi:hypothetical protein